MPSTAGFGLTNEVLPKGATHSPAEATMKRVVTGGWSLTLTLRSYCGYGAVGTLTGRCGVSSNPDTAIHPIVVRLFRQAGSLDRIAHNAL